MYFVPRINPINPFKLHYPAAQWAILDLFFIFHQTPGGRIGIRTLDRTSHLADSLFSRED